MKHILIGAFIIVVIGLVAWYFYQQSNQVLTHDDVKQQVLATQSTISEALLLVKEIEQQKVTSQFAKAHGQALTDQLGNTLQTLSSKADPSLQKSILEDKKIVNKTKKELKLLQNQQSASSIEANLRMQLQKAEKLDKTL